MPPLSIKKLQAKKLQPTIINKDSSFVVVTYWWGRGNKNKNTQRPCPEDYQEGDKLTTRPMTYDHMISQWKKSCRKAHCNYLEVEYPEFAQKGMYQKAINFKPLFIREALKACYPRAVLYIDGDMHVQKYPKIFDIPNVDYMAQGWNSDPRYRMVWEDDFECYYPYVFETSGGTMYFNNTKAAKHLLREWYASVKEFPLKAEDRLISQVFNQQKLLVPMNIIQLPIEYLWLSIDYDTLSKNLWQKSNIYITHPACLTGEDRAFEAGASKQRFPPRYTSQITNQVTCHIKEMPFYEYVYFPSKSYTVTLKEWLRVMNKMGLIKLIPFDKKYGAYNKIYDDNLKKMQTVTTTNKSRNLVHIVLKGSKITGLNNVHLVDNLTKVIPTILFYLKKGNNVIFVPNKATLAKVKRVKERAISSKSEFVCRNKNDRKLKYKREYTLIVDNNYPMYFRADSTVLHHLLYMSRSLANVGQHFSNSFIFPSRIRCEWV